MSIRTTVATLQVTSTNPTGSWETGAWGTKVLTFFKHPSNTDKLRFGYTGDGSTSIPDTSLSDIDNMDWNTGFVMLWWDKDQSTIKWGSKEGGNECCAGLSTANVTLSGIASQSSTNSATETSTSAPSGTTLPSSGDIPIASTPSATATPTAVTNEKSAGLSGGAVAGVAIGCLIAGALIAALILWVYRNRRKSKRVSHSEASATALIPLEKAPLTHTKSITGSLAIADVDRALPQPLEDQAISGEITKISSLIKNHIQSYYHDKVVNSGLIDLDDITALGKDLPFSARRLSALLDDPLTREVALRFCIAWAIVSRIQNYGTSTETLLPPEVCTPMREMMNVNVKSKAHTLRSARWRVTTAELLHATYIRDAFTSSDPRGASIRTLSSILENVLKPFADLRMNDDERKRNLVELLKRSAMFAFTLFSQPSTWTFDWREEQSVESGEFCIFPALVQLTNEIGDPIVPPRSFSEAVTRRLEG